MRPPVLPRALLLALMGAPACLVDNPLWDDPAATGTGSTGDATGESTSGSTSGSTGDATRDSTGGDTDGSLEHPNCEPEPQASMVVQVTPDDAAQLDEIAAAAAPGTALVLEDGVYPRAGEPAIELLAAGVQLRSKNADPTAVVLDGEGSVTDLVIVRADDVLIAELTLRGSAANLVQVAPPADGRLLRPRLHRVHLHDAARFGLAVEADFATEAYADDGVVSCSVFTLGDELRQTIPSCATTSGIKAVGAAGWVVRDSLFEGFWCPSSQAFVAVNFSNGSRDTVIERNELRDNFRGIMLGFQPEPDIGQRSAPAGDCPVNAQHFGGSIVNNMLWVGDPELAGSTNGVDAMVSLWSACGADVRHNTVVNLMPIFSGIEYRFSETTGTIANNLLRETVVERDPAAVVVAGNLEQVGLETFVDPGGGDLHLSPTASVAIDAAVAVGDGPPALDFDGEPRDESPDVGADELSPSG